AAQFAPPSAGSAADELLGERIVALAGAFDSRWREGVAASWKRVYEQTQGRRARLAALRAKCAPACLTVNEALELADLEEELGEGPGRALTLRRELLAREPDSVPARFVLARQLLQQGDRDGVALMEAAMQGEADAVLPGCELLRDYWWGAGQRESSRSTGTSAPRSAPGSSRKANGSVRASGTETCGSSTVSNFRCCRRSARGCGRSRVSSAPTWCASTWCTIRTGRSTCSDSALARSQYAAASASER